MIEKVLSVIFVGLHRVENNPKLNVTDFVVK